MNTPQPLTTGIDHLGLTVADLEKSADFFITALGWQRFGGNETYPAIYVTDGTSRFTLWQRDPGQPRGFDRRANVGLHHTALKVGSEAALHEVFAKVRDWDGVTVEFSPQPSGSGPKLHFMIFEPGGTRLEFTYDPR